MDYNKKALENLGYTNVTITGILMSDMSNVVCTETVTHTYDEIIYEAIKEYSWEHIRAERNQLLLASDWAACRDTPTKIYEIMSTYRQELRDITMSFSTPDDVIFPTRPNI